MTGKNEVTDVKVNVKRPDRRSIYIDGEYAFSISEGIFYDHGIKVGDILTGEKIARLLSADKRQKIKDTAFNLLSYRPRSVGQLKDRLRQKGWETEDIEPVLQELEEKGFVNDREFAKMLARDRTNRKFQGPRAVRNELKRAAVSEDLIEEVMETTYRETSPVVLIGRLLEKRGVDSEAPVSRKEKQRLINLLKRKGYGWDDMEPVISRLKTD